MSIEIGILKAGVNANDQNTNLDGMPQVSTTWSSADHSEMQWTIDVLKTHDFDGLTRDATSM